MAKTPGRNQVLEPYAYFCAKLEVLNILFLANRTPYPPYRGDKLKIYHLAKRLSANHQVYLLCFAENKQDLAYSDHLRSVFKEVHQVYLPFWKSVLSCIPAIFSGMSFQLAYFRSRRMHGQLRAFLDAHPEIDVIHTQHLRMSQYTRHLAQKRILDLPDAYSLYWERRKSVKRPWINRLFDAIESQRVNRAEKVLHQFDLNLACSVEDRDHLIQLHQSDKIKLLRNGVDLETFRYQGHDYSRTGTLLFTGNMDYAPNVDAVIYFCKELLPEIRKRQPGTRLIIAGQRPVSEVKALACDHVQVTGFVEDLSEMYASADVVIAPLRFGAGTQNKVLEAMAMGVPVVCTEIGFKGLEIENGEGCFQATDAESFIAWCSRLLQDEALREKTGQAGLEQARKKFSWDGIALQLESYMSELAGN